MTCCLYRELKRTQGAIDKGETTLAQTILSDVIGAMLADGWCALNGIGGKPALPLLCESCNAERDRQLGIPSAAAAVAKGTG